MARKPRARRKEQTHTDRVRDYCSRHANFSTDEIIAELGLTKQQVWGILNRLKKTGNGKKKPQKVCMRRKEIVEMVLSVGVDRVREVLDFLDG